MNVEIEIADKEANAAMQEKVYLLVIHKDIVFQSFNKLYVGKSKTIYGVIRADFSKNIMGYVVVANHLLLERRASKEAWLEEITVGNVKYDNETVSADLCTPVEGFNQIERQMDEMNKLDDLEILNFCKIVWISKWPSIFWRTVYSEGKSMYGANTIVQ
ncbi:hypothetical protein SUGI_0741390 [Cryptomeria japonica]|nr:hypothetical protein SUGI_0741390 [Cryptomeria japonica]